MPYRFLEDIVMADVAFEAYGNSVLELFESAGQALTNVMIEEVSKIEEKYARDFKVSADSIDMLLFNFLQEILFYKDAEQILFKSFIIAMNEEEKTMELKVKAKGDKISPGRYELITDAKGISLFNFKVAKDKGVWKARVVVDV